MTCPTCKGVRFKTCKDCLEKPNSYWDWRDYEPKKQMYPTKLDWWTYGDGRKLKP